MDEYEAYKQPNSAESTMYGLLEQLDQLSLESKEDERPQTKGKYPLPLSFSFAF